MSTLVIAPHPDDEILGVGGTIAKLTMLGEPVHVCIVTRGYPPLFNEDLIRQGRKEDLKAAELLRTTSVQFLDFPAARLDTVDKVKLNNALSEVINDLKPFVVYIPHRGDIHCDHKVVADAAMVALRPKYDHVVRRIYAYETVSETGWDTPDQQNAFIPDVYEDITGTIGMKTDAMRIFKSQTQRYPAARSTQAVEALAMYRGSTVGFRYAEAFRLIREIRS